MQTAVSELVSTGRRALLICPPFFSYHLDIRNALEAEGYATTWWSDRASDTFLYKLAMRLMPRRIAALSTPHFLYKLGTVESGPVKYVLVVKGEALSKRAVDAMRKKWPSATFHLYIWDGSENARNAETIAPCFDSVATFDPEDATRFGWVHRPLFARSVRPAVVTQGFEKTYDWAFVGTLHSDRHRVIDRLRTQNPKLRGFVFGFVPGTLLLIARRLTDWTLWRAPRGSVGTKPMPATDMLAVMSHSRALVDIQHPLQRGLTMRTIETLLNGTKLITTNAHVFDSDLYDPSRVHVISRTHPYVPPQFLLSDFKPVSPETMARYELRGWVREVLSGASKLAQGHARTRVSPCEGRQTPGGGEGGAALD